LNFDTKLCVDVFFKSVRNFNHGFIDGIPKVTLIFLNEV